MLPTDSEVHRDTQLLRGSVELCVLAAIATQPSHAYEVCERLQSHGLSTVGYGTVYPLVSRLRRQGYLRQETVASPSGPPRNQLALTPAGYGALRDWRSRWDNAATAVQDVLSELDRAGA